MHISTILQCSSFIYYFFPKMDTRDYSKDYKGEPQQIKTTNLILVATGNVEVVLTGDDLASLLLLLDNS